MVPTSRTRRVVRGCHILNMGDGLALWKARNTDRVAGPRWYWRMVALRDDPRHVSFRVHFSYADRSMGPH
jgi:hypothetical protein